MTGCRSAKYLRHAVVNLDGDDPWRADVEWAANEIERLQAIVDRAATTADGAVITQTADETVWRTEGPEGRPQRSEYVQNGMAVFRGVVRVEMKRIEDCYSSREAAEKARTP